MTGEHIRLLLIEDDPDDAELLRMTLLHESRASIGVECRGSLEAGARELAERGADVVLLDLSLPDSKGIDTLERLRNRFPDVPIVVLTAMEDERLALEAVRRGAQDYLEKGVADGRVIRRALRYAVERKQLQAELLHAREIEAAYRAKSEFLANFSHELRTPLHSVFGFTNLLLKNPEGRFNEQDMEYLRRVLQNGKYLLMLLNNLLDLSKIQAGKMDLEVGKVHLPELLKEVLQQCEGQAVGRPVVLSAELPERLAAVQSDPMRLKQILINLVGNALKYTEAGRVTVRVVTHPGVERPDRIEVVDTGTGIPADKLNEIFEAFRQADEDPTRRVKGTGLGLHIARSLATLLGHRLDVESVVGKGSTFRLWLTEARVPAPSSR